MRVPQARTGDERARGLTPAVSVPPQHILAVAGSLGQKNPAFSAAIGPQLRKAARSRSGPRMVHRAPAVRASRTKSGVVAKPLRQRSFCQHAHLHQRTVFKQPNEFQTSVLDLVWPETRNFCDFYVKARH